MPVPGLPLGGYDPYLTGRALPPGAIPVDPALLGTVYHTPFRPTALTAAQQAAQVIDVPSRMVGPGGLGGGLGGTTTTANAARQAAEARLASAAAGPAAGQTAYGIGAPAAAQTAGIAGQAAVPVAAGTEAGAAGAAAQQAAQRGLMARLLGSPAGGGGRLGAALSTGRLAPGTLGRGGLYALGGYLAGQGVEAVVGHREGTLDDAARNAAVGAGLGAGIGSVIPGVGTGIGAGLGAVGGFGYGLLTGGDSDETEAQRARSKEAEKFNEQFARYQVSPDVRNQFMMQFNLSTDGLKKGDINKVAQEMRQMLPGVIIEDAAMQQEARGQEAMFAAAQAWMAPMMQDAFNRSTQFGNELSGLMTENAAGIENPRARVLAQENAARIPLDIATQQAYAMQQMMSLPGLYGYQTQVNSQGVPAMDFQSILGAQPIPGAQVPGAQTAALTPSTATQEQLALATAYAPTASSNPSTSRPRALYAPGGRQIR